jgi:hypothetical protein
VQASISDFVGLAGLGVRMLEDAYSNALKHFGKRKAKALLAEAVREILKIKPRS